MSESIFTVWWGEYEQRSIAAVYVTRELAEDHIRRSGRGADFDIEEYEVKDKPAVWHVYYHGMAQLGRFDPAFDKEPFVEERGPVADWLPEGDRVSHCPSTMNEKAIWLSFFHADKDVARRRVRETYDALRERRETEGLPEWYQFIPGLESDGRVAER